MAELADVKSDKDNSIDRIMFLLEADKIYMPKALNHMGLHERSVLLVSETMTDYRFETIEEVKKILANISDDYILRYALNDEKLAKRIKRDIKKVIDNFENLF